MCIWGDAMGTCYKLLGGVDQMSERRAGMSTEIGMRPLMTHFVVLSGKLATAATNSE